MSTPQDNPNTGPNDQYPDQGTTPGWTTPGTSGTGAFDQSGQQAAGTSPYDQPTDGTSPYGYQGTQPSGYAYPTSGVDAAATEKGPAPKEVMTAYYLILAAGILYLLSSIFSALTTEVPDMAGAALGAGLGLVFAVIGAAIYILLAVFIRRGQNWARITATVFAALNVVLSLGSLLLLPLANEAIEASGQQATETSGLATVLGLVVMVLGVAGVVMTYLKPARPYFAPQKIGY